MCLQKNVCIVNINFILNNLDSFGAILPLAICFRRGFIINGVQKYICFYLLLQVALNSVCSVLAAERINNILLYQANCLASLIFITLFFNEVVPAFKRHGWFKLLSWSLVTILAVYMIFENKNVFNSHSFSYTGLIIVLYSLLFFYNKITHPSLTKITKEPVFWFVTGFFIYYSATFMIFVSYSVLTEEQKIDVNLLWRLHNIIFLIMCIYISVGYLCNTSRKTYY